MQPAQMQVAGLALPHSQERQIFGEVRDSPKHALAALRTSNEPAFSTADYAHLAQSMPAFDQDSGHALDLVIPLATFNTIHLNSYKSKSAEFAKDR
jgi:hypothetical protein